MNPLLSSRPRAAGDPRAILWTGRALTGHVATFLLWFSSAMGEILRVPFAVRSPRLRALHFFPAR